MIKRLSGHLYFWVLVGIFLGAAVGILWPDFGASLKPLGDAFIALIKMLIGPVIFCTVVLGIAGAGDMKKVGRVGGKALLYFEIVSTFALILGIGVANLFKPGQGFQVDPASLSAQAVGEYSRRASEQSVSEFFLHLIPKTFVDAFGGSGDLLQILMVALLFGYSMNRLGKKGEPVHHFMESASHIFLGMVNSVMKLAPIRQPARIKR